MVRRAGPVRRRAGLARALRAAGREPRPSILLELADAGGLAPTEETATHLEAMHRAGLVRPRGTAEDAIAQAPYVLSRTGHAVAALARQLLRS